MLWKEGGYIEQDSEGKVVPVKIRFYTFRRWRSILLQIFLVEFLLAVLAALFRLADMGPDEAVSGRNRVFSVCSDDRRTDWQHGSNSGINFWKRRRKRKSWICFT